MSACARPPPGWWCSREPDHPGPCAARPIEVIDAEIVDDGPSTRELASSLERLGVRGAGAVLDDMEATACEVQAKLSALGAVVSAAKGLGRKIAKALPDAGPRPVVPRNRPR